MMPFSLYLSVLNNFISLVATTPHAFHITCDFNPNLDHPDGSQAVMWVLQFSRD